jgi:hypothetical protein
MTRCGRWEDLPVPVVPDEVELERDHLARSRENLARMRERTAALDSSAAGDWVSRLVL